MRLLPCVILFFALLLGACSGGEERIPPQPMDGNTVPTMVTENVNSLVSDSGITRYHIVAPLWLMFDNADDPFWRFPQGLDMERYDDHMNVTAILVCDTAIYYTRQRIWRLDGNVRMRNIEGDRFLTQQLFWNQNSHKVYSDSFIHIERSDRIIEGVGFVSNEQMTAYTVRRPTGIFPISEFRKSADTIPN